MTADEFASRYRLVQQVTSGAIRTFHATSSAGAVVMVHFVDAADSRTRLLERIDRLPDAEKQRVIEVADVEGRAVVVTRFILDFVSLDRWLDQSAADRADPGARTAEPKQPGEFTRMFMAQSPPAPGGRPDGDAPSAEPDAVPPISEPAAGEFTQLFQRLDEEPPKTVKPPPANAPHQHAPPLDATPGFPIFRAPDDLRPEGQHSTQAGASPDRPSALADRMNVDEVSEGPGEFTRMFRPAAQSGPAQHTPDRHRDAPAPGAPAPGSPPGLPPAATGPRAPDLPTGKPPAQPPAPLHPGSAPASPLQSGPAHSRGPGGSPAGRTPTFGQPAPPGEASAGPRTPFFGGGSAARQPGDTPATPDFGSGRPLPRPGPPEPPKPASDGQFTRLFRAPPPPGGPGQPPRPSDSPFPAPGAPTASPGRPAWSGPGASDDYAARLGTQSPGAAAGPRPPAPQPPPPPPQPSGPGEYTRVISAASLPSAPQPPAAAPQWKPAEPAKPEHQKPSVLPLAIGLSVIALLAIAIVLVLLLR